MPKCSHSARSRWSAPAVGLGHGEEQLRNAVGESGLAHGVDGGDRLHQRLGRAARLRDHHEARGLEVEAGQSQLERAGVEIVVEARARTRLAAMLVVAGNAPAAELGERLAAEARSAGAEKHQRARAVGEPLERLAGGSDVVPPFRHAQHRQRRRRHRPRATRRAVARAWRDWPSSEAGGRPAAPMPDSRQPCTDCDSGTDRSSSLTSTSAPERLAGSCLETSPPPACRRWW